MKMVETGPIAHSNPLAIATDSTGTPVDAATPWDQLVRDHMAAVYGFAYRLTRNPHDAEDLTQDVFVRVFRNLASYTPGNFDGWLYRITVNMFRDHVRHNQLIRVEPFQEDSHKHPTEQRSPEQVATDSVFDDDVLVALAEMKPDYRAAVLLRDIDGYAYAEISEALDIKPGTVGSRLHRGRAHLRASLAHRASPAGRTGARSSPTTGVSE